MHKILFSLTLSLFLGLSASYAQDVAEMNKEIPKVELKDINGNTVSSDIFDNDGKPMVISFWATWCKPCILELRTIAEEYVDWQEETGVKIIAVSIDDARNSAKVKPFINGRGWDFEVYIDQNQDLKRALSVNNVPHTFLVNGEKEIIWNHSGYAPGDEEELYDQILKLSSEKK